MALKDVLKSLTGKKKDEVSRQNDAASALIASEQFPIIRASDMNVSKYKQVPLMGLATLGAAFMQLPETARTITSTVTKSVDLHETLFVGVNPKGVAGFLRDCGQGVSGNIMQINEQGKQVIAGRMRFKAINQLPVTETTATVVPIEPMTMVIALCFHRDMAAIQHFKSVAGAVSYGKKHCRRRQFVNVSDRIADAQTVYFFVAEINVNQTIFKTVFTAERNDFTAYLLNNQSQPDFGESRSSVFSLQKHQFTGSNRPSASQAR